MRRRNVLTMLASGVAAIALTTMVALAAESNEPTKAKMFSLEDHNGNVVKLEDHKDKIVVLEWINPGCPFVVRHYKAKTFATLAEKYKDKDVVWLAIDSSHFTTNDKNKAWAEKHDLSYAILNDASGEVGKAYGAKTTPHMFIVKDGMVVYNGAIDDDPRGKKGDDAINYVDKALQELLAGSAVSTPKTKPYGCGVKYKR